MLLVLDVIAGGFERLTLFRLGVAARHRTGLEAGNDAIDLVIEIGRLFGRPRDDQRRPRLVNQNAVDLVDDGEVVPALDVVRELEFHVVAQVVEAELVVSAVSDVPGVGHLALSVVKLVLDDADGHAEETVDSAHPFGIAARQIVIDRDDVDAFAFEGVEIGGESGDQRFAFAGLHLGDLALMQNGAADQLNVEVPHVQHAAPCLANDRKGFGHHVVERLPIRHALFELCGLRPELVVRQRLDGRLEGVHRGHDRAKPLQFAFVLGSDDFGEKRIDHAVRPTGMRVSQTIAQTCARLRFAKAGGFGLSDSQTEEPRASESPEP